MSETLEISLKADTRELINALKELPGIGAKEARAMVRGIQREYRAAERAAKRTATVTRKEFEEGFEGIGTAIKAFEGQIGGAFSVFEDFTEGLGKASGVLGPFGTTLGAVALGASAGAFAVAGLGAAALSLANSAIDANDRLVKLGMANKASSSAVKELDQAMKALEVSADLALTEIVSNIPQLERFVTVLAGGLNIFAQVSDQLGGIAEKAETVGRVMGAIGSLGTSELLWRGFEAAEAQGEGLQLRIEQVGEEAKQLGAEPVRVVEDLRDKIRQAKEAAAEAARAMGEWRQASDTLQGIVDAMNADQLTDLQAIRIKYQDLREQVAGLAGDEGLRSDALTAINEREQREIDAVNAARAQAAADETARQRQLSREYEARWQAFGEDAAEAQRMAEDAARESSQSVSEYWEQAASDAANALMGVAADVLGSFTELNNMRIAELQEQAEMEVQAAERSNEAWYQTQTARIQRDLETGRISAKEASEERKRINEEMRARQKAARALARDERRAALKSWRANQTIARTQAIMGAAQNAVALVPAFSFLGPGAPIAAATLAAASLAPQLAVINRQKPPEFPMGGMVSPDHMLVGAQAGEGVATRRGVAAMGGPEALQRFNEGQRGSGDRIVVQLGRRTLAEAVRDVQRDLQSVLLDPRIGQYDHNGGS